MPPRAKSAMAASESSAPDGPRAPSLVPVAVVGTLVTIVLGVSAWLLSAAPGAESGRFLLLAFSGPAVTAFAGTGVAYVRGYRARELGWLIPVTLVIGVGATAPLAYMEEPTAASFAMAALAVGLAFLLGGLAFALVGVPATILLRAMFARVKPPASHVWWSVAALIFAVSALTVAAAVGDVGTGTNTGRGLTILLRVVGVPVGEIKNEGALWLTRFLVALAIVPAVLGYRAHQRENPKPRRRGAGQGRRKRENRYKPPRRQG